MLDDSGPIPGRVHCFNVLVVKMRIILAFKVFFKTLFSGEFAKSIRKIQSGEVPAAPKLEKKEAPKPAPKPKPTRSDAITLLAALQREARFIDIVQEPLGDYTDEQIGSASRDVLRDTAKVLERFFDIQPLTDADEGATIEAPENHDPQRYHLIGNVSGDGPMQGQLTHHGWVANQCEIPKWTGKSESRNIIAPIEIQV